MLVTLFDIDGTLVSTGGAGKAAMEAALHSAFGAPASAAGVPFSGRTDRAITRDLFALYDIADTPANWERFRTEYLGHLPDTLRRSPGRVLPGIAELLQYLAGREDTAVGLLTGNIQDGARLKLGHFQIDHYFPFGGFGDHHFDRDCVAGEALDAVRRHVNGTFELENLWVIGDTPHDVTCARSIGARVIGVATGWTPLADIAKAKPDLLLKDLSDPTPVLELWESA